MKAVCVITGAGMSAESGVPTFRGAQEGLWERFDPMQLATPEAFAEDPDLVWAWYMWRLAVVRGAEPNAGHRAIAEHAERGGQATVVTQNVDDLHERAGSTGVLHVHGSVTDFRCAECGAPYTSEVVLPAEAVERLAPPECACGGLVRPGVVWFGEALPQDVFDRAVDAVRAADEVLVVGTSALVYPAAQLPLLALDLGKRVVEVNPERTPLSGEVAQFVQDTAARALPRLLAQPDRGT